MNYFVLSFFIHYIFHNAAVFYPTEDEQSSTLYITAQFLPCDNTGWLLRKEQWVWGNISWEL